MSWIAYVGFGSNLGDRQAKFDETLDALAQLPSTIMKGASSLYETAAVGLSDGGGPFINAVICLDTDLSPGDLSSELRGIELALGKPVTHRSDRSRVIDLDLLLYGDQHIHEDGLEIPHPRMHNRAFVLVPLAEVAADVVHPVLMKTVKSMAEMLPRSDVEGVRRAGDGR